MAKNTSLTREFTKGLWDENPVLISLLGLCPTLAVTNSAVNGIAMGLATTFVVVSSSVIISSLRNLIPHQVRIASYIVIIATFVTLADRFLAAFTPEISKALGPYVPLIVVNCLILGRQEAFSSKNTPGRSFIDALGMGTGFLLVLFVLGGIREILGSGSLLNITLLGDWFSPWMVMILPPGAFLTLGLLIGLANWINERRAEA
ncbi:MAG: electron transport complex subunit E [Candidatus Marinimicrobia bacterium]|nr:electron transport complex subunit E [Candidatus Neomarinimicrobiota bacterium]MCF7827343.1 electron transport complex subunit E [Candidatus Neomarinimicrobiota bacterium]MCF7881424.1 electron transport complex subunit E [Candidatus Neomarinimicrobiota bacterium]